MEGARRPISRGLSAFHIYRPGSLLAGVMLAGPPVLGVSAGAIALIMTARVPIALPLLLLAWIAVLPAGWLVLVSVRTSPIGIATARPWRKWQEIPWALIERAEHRGVRLVLTASDGRTISFALFVLHGGDRLYREVLLRLSPQVLDIRLRHDAQMLLGENLGEQDVGGFLAPVQVQPRLMWRVTSAAIALAAAALALVAFSFAPPESVLASALCAAIALAASLAFVWLSQRITLSDEGIAVALPLRRRSRAIAWSDLHLIEHTRRERFLRLRGARRVRCAGPGMLVPVERDVMRALLLGHARRQGALVVERRWLL
jgi:hypothetical protein